MITGIAKRCFFFPRNRGTNENLDSYVTEMRLLAKTFNFRTLRDPLIWDWIMCGGNKMIMRERLLQGKNLTLDTCIQLSRDAELL